MDNDKNPTNRDNSVINNDKSRGLNEIDKHENARNNYENSEPSVNQSDDIAPADLNAVNDDISPLENGPQKKPGSSGAFPVGAFDTSKD
jgi:hypothetical protein